MSSPTDCISKELTIAGGIEARIVADVAEVRTVGLAPRTAGQAMAEATIAVPVQPTAGQAAAAITVVVAGETMFAT
ncbi:MAG: hypothetical protein HOP32_12550 [Nitrospira sp.]|nr:hypothetical protein [Nitrospira sp.]